MLGKVPAGMGRHGHPAVETGVIRATLDHHGHVVVVSVAVPDEKDMARNSWKTLCRQSRGTFCVTPCGRCITASSANTQRADHPEITGKPAAGAEGTRKRSGS